MIEGLENIGIEQEQQMPVETLGKKWISENRDLEWVFRSFEEDPDALMEIIRRRSGEVEGGTYGIQS